MFIDTAWSQRPAWARASLLLLAALGALVVVLLAHATATPGVLLAVNVFATPSWVLKKGASANPQPLTDQTVPIKITDQTHILFDYDSWAASLFIDDYMERYGNPAIDQITNEIDETGLARMYPLVAKAVGTPAVVPGSTGTLPFAANQVYLDAQTKLREVAIPGPYKAVLSPNMHAYLSNANATLFNPSGLIAAAYKNGQFGEKALGISAWFMDQTVPPRVVGALGGTPPLNTAAHTR